LKEKLKPIFEKMPNEDGMLYYGFSYN